ncbi:MAG: DNA double-strand break repair nuclease NurA [Chloroflexi bacterium]|nr:DNA double-strand break repair nuclease NurA [Chloroflexota bacterium]
MGLPPSPLARSAGEGPGVRANPPSPLARSAGEGPGVRALSHLLDRDLFTAILTRLGDRSDVFVNPLAFPPDGLGRGIGELYHGNEVHFFYLNAGDEIARVEVPPWVAADPVRLDLVHAVVADQVRRGEGYPVALAEAHEQAVLGDGDRDVFWELVEGMAASRGISFGPSAKAAAKRRRGL